MSVATRSSRWFFQRVDNERTRGCNESCTSDTSICSHRAEETWRSAFRAKYEIKLFGTEWARHRLLLSVWIFFFNIPLMASGPGTMPAPLLLARFETLFLLCLPTTTLQSHCCGDVASLITSDWVSSTCYRCIDSTHHLERTLQRVISLRPKEIARKTKREYTLNIRFMLPGGCVPDT